MENAILKCKFSGRIYFWATEIFQHETGLSFWGFVLIIEKRDKDLIVEIGYVDPPKC